MPHSSNPMDQNEEITKSTHLFSLEAFEVAKLFAGGDMSAALKARAGELKQQIPVLAARAKTADPEYQPDLNRALSDANLDLNYVLAAGRRPSSTRLMYFIQDQANQNPAAED